MPIDLIKMAIIANCNKTHRYELRALARTFRAKWSHERAILVFFLLIAVVGPESHLPAFGAEMPPRETGNRNRFAGPHKLFRPQPIGQRGYGDLLEVIAPDPRAGTPDEKRLAIDFAK